MSKLKPCPHCESAATLFTSDEIRYLGPDRFTVKCNSCFCGTGYYANPGRAIEAWNRRAQHNEPLTCKGCERFGTGEHGFVGPKMCVGCIRKWQAQCIDHYRRKPEGGEG